VIQGQLKTEISEAISYERKQRRSLLVQKKINRLFVCASLNPLIPIKKPRNWHIDGAVM
jgi:hypothetical protein